MFGYEEARDSYDRVHEHRRSHSHSRSHDDDDDDGHHHKHGKLSHELIAAAASFEAMKLFEDHQRKQGKKVSHSLAKELLAGFVGSQIEKYAEAEYDRRKVKAAAKERADQLYESQYSHHEVYDPKHHKAHESVRHHHRKHGGDDSYWESDYRKEE